MDYRARNLLSIGLNITAMVSMGFAAGLLYGRGACMLLAVSCANALSMGATLARKGDWL